MQNKGCLNFNCRAKVLSICKHISISNTLPRLTLALAILLDHIFYEFVHTLAQPHGIGVGIKTSDVTILS